MSLIPAFEIGVWNAWILMLYPALHPLIIWLVLGKEGWKRLGNPDGMSFTKAQQRIGNVSTAILALLSIYSIFLPLKLGTIWFYLGLPVYLIGFITFTIAIVNVATTPLDEPFTRGMYRYSRHPLYATYFLMFIGVGIASASWVFLLFSIVHIIPSFFHAIWEERFCLKKYGDAYRRYMNKSPRWIGIPKSGEIDKI